MATYADVDNIFNQYKGNFAGPVYGGVHQCVAWAAVYTGLIQGVGYLPTPASGGARDIYEVFAGNLPQNFTRIPNTPDGVPQKGDVVIWGAGIGPYGHIAVANGVGDTNTFQSYDQNWVHGQCVTLYTHNYNAVLGWLRPNNLHAAPAAQGEAMTTPNNAKDLYMELLGRPANDDEANAWANKPWDIVYYAIKDSPEGQAYQKAKAQTLADLQTQIKSQADQIAALNAQLNKPTEPVTAPHVPVDQPHQNPDAVVVKKSTIKKIVDLLTKLIIGTKK